jgi:hypothetical protein
MKTVKNTMDQNEIQKVVLIVLKYRVNSLLPIAQKPQPIRAINPYFTCSTEHYSKLHDEVANVRNYGCSTRFLAS